MIVSVSGNPPSTNKQILATTRISFARVCVEITEDTPLLVLVIIILRIDDSYTIIYAWVVMEI